MCSGLNFSSWLVLVSGFRYQVWVQRIWGWLDNGLQEEMEGRIKGVRSVD